jgi:hypothetical protein
MMTTIANFLNRTKKSTVNLERVEPTLPRPAGEHSFEAELEKDFASIEPVPAQSLNPAYVMAMAKSAQS